MLKRLLSTAAVVVGLAAWVSRAHAVRFWGYMHQSGEWGSYEGCITCDPGATDYVYYGAEPFHCPYNLYIINLTTGDTARWEGDWYCANDPGGRTYYELFWTSFFSIGDWYKVVVFWGDPNLVGPCAYDSCIYIGVVNSEDMRVDVKMHAVETHPAGGVGPYWNEHPENSAVSNIAWSDGNLIVSAVRTAFLSVKAYDVLGRQVMESSYTLEPGDNIISVPLKGVGFIIVSVNGGRYKVLKVIK